MNKTYSKNRKAYNDYTMVESFEAGMKLSGAQVKSIRASTVNLLGSYASVENNGKQIFLKQCHISRPDHLGAEAKGFDEHAYIPLLLSKKQIRDIHKMVKEKGTSLIVTEIYQRDDTKVIKCKLNVAKGKRDYDKRETLKRKSQEMDTKRALKDY
jgi:SsrA-binding protein